MKVTEGDLIKKAKKGEFDLIVHGCNCFCTMGGGIAKGIKSEFPEAFDADQETPKGSKEKLGTCSFAKIEREGIHLIVVNGYTQFDYRGPDYQERERDRLTVFGDCNQTPGWHLRAGLQALPVGGQHLGQCPGECGAVRVDGDRQRCV